MFVPVFARRDAAARRRLHADPIGVYWLGAVALMRSSIDLSSTINCLQNLTVIVLTVYEM